MMTLMLLAFACLHAPQGLLDDLIRNATATDGGEGSGSEGLEELFQPVSLPVRYSPSIFG